ESWPERMRSLGPLYSIKTRSRSASPSQATTSGWPPADEAAAALIPRYAARSDGGNASGVTIHDAQAAGVEPNVSTQPADHPAPRNRRTSSISATLLAPSSPII